MSATEVRPEDAMTGQRDPAFFPTFTTVRASHAVCTCGFEVLELRRQDAIEAMNEHLLDHPASLNPELTCHARDDEAPVKQCMRAKGHSGDHWMHYYDGGVWWPNALSGNRAS